MAHARCDACHARAHVGLLRALASLSRARRASHALRYANIGRISPSKIARKPFRVVTPSGWLPYAESRSSTRANAYREPTQIPVSTFRAEPSATSTPFATLTLGTRTRSNWNSRHA